MSGFTNFRKWPAVRFPGDQRSVVIGGWGVVVVIVWRVYVGFGLQDHSGGKVAVRLGFVSVIM